MIQITFPDGSVRSYESGVTGLDVAKSISQGLAKKAVSIKVNGQVRDLSRAINDDATIQILTWDDKEGKATFWHSSAHLMAEAIEALYPGTKFGIGPAIDQGFYYDIDPGDQVIGAEDLQRIEKKMQEMAQKKSDYIRTEMPKTKAVAYFTEKGDQYKLDLLEDLEDGQITFYQQGDFTDLCRGPHVPNTEIIKAVKLTNISGAYWRGDESNKQLTRIYGITFPKQKDLDEYLLMLEEAKKRDHRKLGKDLEIFTFDDDVGPGLPLWLPNGAFLIEQLEWFAKKTEEEMGYLRVRTPHIAKENLYLTSGHLPYYKESMFPPMELDGTTYYLKAMNCPHHHKIFASSPRSYKELPLRLAEYGTCYRYEKSGELFGLMRVRSLQMNDAHIYCTKDQFESEFKRVNELYLRYFDVFGIDKYVMRFSTHEPSKLGKKYVDNPALWAETENMVRRVLIDSGIPYEEVPDEAAFYGPKIDIQIWSAIGREFTLATNQVDFAQPLRFNLTFTTSNNENEHPIVIHRAPLSTHERFIGFLLEHYAGKFPMWLAPKQCAILPIADRHIPFAQEVQTQLKKAGVRSQLDDRSESIGRKIRDAETGKIPYMLIIGDKEQEAGQVAVRKQGEGDQGSMTVDDFAQLIRQLVEDMH
ncbi:MAG TPA: threonine--tRNA ligase [Saprospiraceae bacterium]|nr:threonine--tRNA ligase [Saprospiraceae bacterium]MCB9272008.1 threonine--tRNA ligase [Lewinellaceae bacterium]HPG09213.1 threonine--tRNA ligase [Saprospiraceae bacterium]HPQ98561.1 threonine--tRNA ligase [Saprospiraceae bacterium]HRV85946.1 threonine--tRNA ligase [Saprospiraceae bacterium]